jgi:hypothetical protein
MINFYGLKFFHTTLAHDLKFLAENGYVLQKVVPDMFQKLKLVVVMGWRIDE